VNVITFRETSVTDATAQRLLGAYFAERARTFPPAQGAYRTTFPTEEQFVTPAGVFLLVIDESGEAVGCGGIRRLHDGDTVRYEIKHLWVSPTTRGTGAGRALLGELERRAALFGAEEAVLDTNESLEAAGSLYRSSGYESVPPYNENPNATHWYAKRLMRSAG
jgi:ribosomal protein S18 acetylase RimI-like enzyme